MKCEHNNKTERYEIKIHEENSLSSYNPALLGLINGFYGERTTPKFSGNIDSFMSGSYHPDRSHVDISKENIFLMKFPKYVVLVDFSPIKRYE